MNNIKKIKILWSDAVFYTTHDVIPKSITMMETTGMLEEESDRHIIVKDPITFNLEKQKKHPVDKQPSFYFIPKEMITDIEYLD